MKARVTKKKDALRQKRKEKLILNEMPKLRAKVRQADAAGEELRRMLDAILIQTAISYGACEKDEETGDVLGWRLELPDVAVEDTLGKYTLKASKSEGKLTLGAFEKDLSSDLEKNIQK